MKRFATALVAAVILASAAEADCGLAERFCFSAASPGYPAKEFWAPRLYRAHACHWPVSVSVCPPTRCDVTPGFYKVGPYCPGSQPHFPLTATPQQ